MAIARQGLRFNEQAELLARMNAVGDIIEREGFPDILLLQEVTQNMVIIFSQSAWFCRYHCSPVPEQSYFTLLLARRDTVTLPGMQPWNNKDFPGSRCGRGILYTRAVVAGRPLVVGTTHLESPVGPGADEERQRQLPQAVRELEAAAGPWGDALLAGDLNWSGPRDGPLPVPPSWTDAWPALMPNHAGATYDAAANPMLGGGRYKGSRLDRVLARLPSAAPASGAGRTCSGTCGPAGGGFGGGGWLLGSIKLIGTAALPGLTMLHARKGKLVPVLPSDHFGLLVKLLPAGAASGTGGGRVLGSGPAGAPAPGRGPSGGRLLGSGPLGPAGAGGSAGGSSSGGASTKGAGAGAGAAPTSGGAATHAPKPPAAAKPLSAGAVAGNGRATAAPPAAGPAKIVAVVDLSVEDDDDDDVVMCDGKGR